MESLHQIACGSNPYIAMEGQEPDFIPAEFEAVKFPCRSTNGVWKIVEATEYSLVETGEQVLLKCDRINVNGNCETGEPCRWNEANGSQG